MVVKAYVAGPLFTPGDRQYLEEIDKICKELGIQAYLPHRDAGLLVEGASAEATAHIFEKDKEAVQYADIIIAVLNGVMVDDGTAWEMGYAYAQGKPIIGIIEDTRLKLLTNLNAMILNSVQLVRSFEDLKKALIKYTE